MNRSVLRLMAVSALTLATTLTVAAGPAGAHALDGSGPTNYRTRIKAIEPDVAGVEVRVVEAGAQLEIVNRSDADVTVSGYAEDPYLRVGPDGVFVNELSPATYLNASRLPDSSALPANADPEAEPKWKKVSDGNSYRWHDHRAHWMGELDPGPVRANPDVERVIYPSWKVDLFLADGSTAAVTGDLTWVPGPSPWPWIAAAGLAMVGVLVTARKAAPKVVARLTGGILLLVVALDLTRLVGVADDGGVSVMEAAGKNLQGLLAWVLGVVAAGALLTGRRALPVAAAAGSLFLLSALLDLNQVTRSQLPTTVPEAFVRLSVALGLGLGAAVIAVALDGLLRPPDAIAPDAARPDPLPTTAA